MLRGGISGVLAAVACCVAASSAAADGAHPGHAGRWITDAQGRVLILHGMNMVYKRPPYTPKAIGFNAPDAAFLAREGYDVVRVGVIYKALEPVPGHYDLRYLAQIADTVRTLARRGIYSLLDFHQDMYNEKFQGEGWPDWAVLDDGLPAEPKNGFPVNYLTMPALQRAFDNFWDDKPAPDGVGLQEHYANAVRQVAKYFRSVPYVLGYELMNEPWPGSAWQECAQPAGCPVSDARLAAFTKKMIARARTVDRRTLVWYEPHVLFNFGSDTQIGAPGDARSGFAFHDYCLADQGGEDPESCATEDGLVFSNALKHVETTRDALMVTEFGATKTKSINLRIVTLADQHMVPWTFWHYCGCSDPTTAGPGDEQAVVKNAKKPPAGKNLDTGKLAVLTRPYPRVIAGTPKSFGFDPDTHVFTLRYSTARASGGRLPSGLRSEVFVPRRQYPKGYTASVKGGAIAAAARTRLSLVACPGAKEVDVRVMPRAGRSRGSCRITSGRGAQAR